MHLTYRRYELFVAVEEGEVPGQLLSYKNGEQVVNQLSFQETDGLLEEQCNDTRSNRAVLGAYRIDCSSDVTTTKNIEREFDTSESYWYYWLISTH